MAKGSLKDRQTAAAFFLERNVCERHLSANTCIEGFLDGVSGEGNVTEAVPRHGEELEDTEEDGEALLAQDEGREERKD